MEDNASTCELENTSDTNSIPTIMNTPFSGAHNLPEVYTMTRNRLIRSSAVAKSSQNGRNDNFDFQSKYQNLLVSQYLTDTYDGRSEDSAQSFPRRSRQSYGVTNYLNSTVSFENATGLGRGIVYNHQKNDIQKKTCVSRDEINTTRSGIAVIGKGTIKRTPVTYPASNSYIWDRDKSFNLDGQKLQERLMTSITTKDLVYKSNVEVYKRRDSKRQVPPSTDVSECRIATHNSKFVDTKSKSCDTFLNKFYLKTWKYKSHNHSKKRPNYFRSLEYEKARHLQLMSKEAVALLSLKGPSNSRDKQFLLTTPNPVASAARRATSERRTANNQLNIRTINKGPLVVNPSNVSVSLSSSTNQKEKWSASDLKKNAVVGNTAIYESGEQSFDHLCELMKLNVQLPYVDSPRRLDDNSIYLTDHGNAPENKVLANLTGREADQSELNDINLEDVNRKMCCCSYEPALSNYGIPFIPTTKPPSNPPPSAFGLRRNVQLNDISAPMYMNVIALPKHVSQNRPFGYGNQDPFACLSLQLKERPLRKKIPHHPKLKKKQPRVTAGDTNITRHDSMMVINKLNVPVPTSKIPREDIPHRKGKKEQNTNRSEEIVECRPSPQLSTPRVPYNLRCGPLPSRLKTNWENTFFVPTLPLKQPRFNPRDIDLVESAIRTQISKKFLKMSLVQTNSMEMDYDGPECPETNISYAVQEQAHLSSREEWMNDEAKDANKNSNEALPCREFEPNFDNKGNRQVLQLTSSDVPRPVASSTNSSRAYFNSVSSNESIDLKTDCTNNNLYTPRRCNETVTNKNTVTYYPPTRNIDTETSRSWQNQEAVLDFSAYSNTYLTPIPRDHDERYDHQPSKRAIEYTPVRSASAVRRQLATPTAQVSFQNGVQPFTKVSRKCLPTTDSDSAVRSIGKLDDKLPPVTSKPDVLAISSGNTSGNLSITPGIQKVTTNRTFAGKTLKVKSAPTDMRARLSARIASSSSSCDGPSSYGGPTCTSDQGLRNRNSSSDFSLCHVNAHNSTFEEHEFDHKLSSTDAFKQCKTQNNPWLANKIDNQCTNKQTKFNMRLCGHPKPLHHHININGSNKAQTVKPDVKSQDKISGENGKCQSQPVFITGPLSAGGNQPKTQPHQMNPVTSIRRVHINLSHLTNLE